jgi:hypothetical protein
MAGGGRGGGGRDSLDRGEPRHPIKESRMTASVGFTEAFHSMSDLAGFGVEASDGRIGEVVEVLIEPGGSRIVVDLGPTLRGRTVALPVDAVRRVSRGDRMVCVARSREDVKAAPKVHKLQQERPEDHRQLIDRCDDLP